MHHIRSAAFIFGESQIQSGVLPIFIHNNPVTWQTMFGFSALLWQWFQVLRKVFPVHLYVHKVITINSKLLRTPVSEIIGTFKPAQNALLGCGSLPNLMHCRLNFAYSHTLLDACRDYNTFCRYMLFCLYYLYYSPVSIVNSYLSLIDRYTDITNQITAKAHTL